MNDRRLLGLIFDSRKKVGKLDRSLLFRLFSSMFIVTNEDK